MKWKQGVAGREVLRSMVVIGGDSRAADPDVVYHQPGIFF